MLIVVFVSLVSQKRRSRLIVKTKNKERSVPIGNLMLVTLLITTITTIERILGIIRSAFLEFSFILKIIFYFYFSFVVLILIMNSILKNKENLKTEQLPIFNKKFLKMTLKILWIFSVKF